MTATTGATPPHLPAGGFRVLVVDDDELSREVMRELLRSLGGRVDLAADGNEALTAVRRQPYDLVLMDLRMPVLDGHAATVKIRRDERFRDLPIVAYSGCAEETERRDCLASGMSDYLAKPIDITRLRKILTRWLPSPSAHADSTPMLSPEDELRAGLERLVTSMSSEAAARLLQKAHDFLPRDFEALWESLERGDQAAVTTAAHRLRGALLIYGAKRLAERVGELQEADPATPEDARSPGRRALQSELDSLLRTMRQVEKDLLVRPDEGA